MADGINILMGEYRIECDKDQVIWRVTDVLTGSHEEFDTLADVMEWIESELDLVEIEEAK